MLSAARHLANHQDSFLMIAARAGVPAGIKLSEIPPALSFYKSSRLPG